MAVRGRRFLLNPPGIQSTAAIVAEVEDSSRWPVGKDGDGRDLDLDPDKRWTLQPRTILQISNCDRSIAFAFDWNTAAQRRSGLVKIDKMVEALQALRAGLEEEHVRYAERVRWVKKNPPPAAPV